MCSVHSEQVEPWQEHPPWRKQGEAPPPLHPYLRATRTELSSGPGPPPPPLLLMPSPSEHFQPCEKVLIPPFSLFYPLIGAVSSTSSSLPPHTKKSASILVLRRCSPPPPPSYPPTERTHLGVGCLKKYFFNTIHKRAGLCWLPPHRHGLRLLHGQWSAWECDHRTEKQPSV